MSLDKKYLDALDEADAVSRASRKTPDEQLERYGYRDIQELDLLAVWVAKGGGVDVYIYSAQPKEFFNEVLKEVRRRRQGQSDVISRNGSGKVIRYVPKFRPA